MTLSTGEEIPCPIGLNYDALVIIDATEDGIVRVVEILIKSSLWRSARLPPVPTAAVVRSMRLIGLTTGDHFIDDVAIGVEIDRKAGSAALWFAGAVDGRWEPVSPTVAAMVHLGRLQGLLFRVEDR